MHRSLLRPVLISIVAFFCSCGGKEDTETTVNRFQNQVVSLADDLDNPDGCRTALSFLDSATAIDNKCFNCFYNKMMFLSSLQEHDKVIATLDTCIQLKPNAHDLYLTGGILNEKWGDSIAAKPYFERSLSICNAVLDTMKIQNRNYAMLTMHKAINLVLLGDSIQANKVLRELYDSQAGDPVFEKLWKENTTMLMNKTRAQLIDSLRKSVW